MSFARDTSVSLTYLLTWGNRNQSKQLALSADLHNKLKRQSHKWNFQEITHQRTFLSTAALSSHTGPIQVCFWFDINGRLASYSSNDEEERHKSQSYFKYMQTVSSASGTRSNHGLEQIFISNDPFTHRPQMTTKDLYILSYDAAHAAC